ncbi:MAG TPA: hypothetical protein VFF30_18700 [Nitrososphaerales archaeon]|nr:hypothetical protein [Nitrososphaerales archaeon]
MDSASRFARRRRRAEAEQKAATKILADVSQDKAFYFYSAIDAPTGKSARNFSQFVELINVTELPIIEFHSSRGDFSKWITMLGDEPLARQVEDLKKEKLSPEIYHQRLVKLLTQRLQELQKKQSGSVSKK